MAIIRYDSPINRLEGDDVRFSKLYKPGELAQLPGIYHCEVCDLEIVAKKGESLPELGDRHPHKTAEITWRLIVWAHHPTEITG